MKMIKSNDVTEDHIKKVNYEFEIDNGEKVLSNYGYAFFYNQMFVNDIDYFDAHRYANLNTVIGYDVGVEKFCSLEEWLWENNYDLIELRGSDDDKELLEEAAKKCGYEKDLDFSNWRKLPNDYTFSYFENGEEFK